MKTIASILFLINALLWASYYPVCKEALDRFDPALFAVLDLSLLLPPALVLLFTRRRYLNRTLVRCGVISGVLFGLAIFTVTLSLNFTSATNTGFLVSLDGMFAVIIAGVILGNVVHRAQWLMAAVSALGVTLILVESTQGGGNWLGDLLALASGLLYLAYLFCTQSGSACRQTDKLGLMGIQFLSAFMVAALAILPFADFDASSIRLPTDIYVLVYVSVFTTLVPAVVTIFCAHYLSAITISFIYILEPVLVSLIAIWYLDEHLTAIAYAGGSLIVISACIEILRENGMLNTRRGPVGGEAPAAIH